MAYLVWLKDHKEETCGHMQHALATDAAERFVVDMVNDADDYEFDGETYRICTMHHNPAYPFAKSAVVEFDVSVELVTSATAKQVSNP